jgi:hypothetical protein
MAYTAKDGSKHTNKETQKRADAKFGAKKSGPSVTPGVGQVEPDADEMGGASDMDQDDMGQQDPHQVVEQHGPAQEVTIQHGAGHTVDSMHGDGHQQHSEHGSAAEAHKHATCLGGGCDCGAM